MLKNIGRVEIRSGNAPFLCFLAQGTIISRVHTFTHNFVFLAARARLFDWKSPKVHTTNGQIESAGKQPILTRGIGYTRIGHRTGRRVFFERIETDDVTTVLTWREDSAALICLCASPQTKTQELRAKQTGGAMNTKTASQRNREMKTSDRW